MLAAVEGQGHQPVVQHGEDERDASKMERRLGEDRFTCEEGLGNLLGDANGPVVVPIGTIGEGDQKAGVRDSSHRREKPFRDDRFLGPRM